jgi:PAS domain S-box-containing protein
MSPTAQQSQEPVSEEEVLGTPACDAQMLHRLLGNLDGMVFRCRNDAHSTMEFVSEGCIRLTGAAAQDLVGNREHSFASLVHADDRESRRRVLSEAISTRERYAVQYRLTRRDGAVRWLSERGMALFDASERPCAFEGFIEDISERKRAEEALE